MGDIANYLCLTSSLIAPFLMEESNLISLSHTCRAINKTLRTSTFYFPYRISVSTSLLFGKIHGFDLNINPPEKFHLSLINRKIGTIYSSNPSAISDAIMELDKLFEFRLVVTPITEGNSHYSEISFVNNTLTIFRIVPEICRYCHTLITNVINTRTSEITLRTDVRGIVGSYCHYFEKIVFFPITTKNVMFRHIRGQGHKVIYDFSNVSINSLLDDLQEIGENIEMYGKERFINLERSNDQLLSESLPLGKGIRIITTPSSRSMVFEVRNGKMVLIVKVSHTWGEKEITPINKSCKFALDSIGIAYEPSIN